MELGLQNLRTGETRPLDPDRTLVGVADHAAVRTDGGPFLAALAVRYPAGWALHGLSDDPEVTFNRSPLGVGRQVTPHPGDILRVKDGRFCFVAAPGTFEAPAAAADPPPTCFAYIRNPDGMEECRVVDHDLLFGRLAVAHVRFPDKRLSRLAALLAAHGGAWYVHALAKSPLGRNGHRVDAFAPLEDGDELLVGPLVVRIELRAAAPDTSTPSARFEAMAAVPDPVTGPANPDPPPGATDLPSATVDGSNPDGSDLAPELVSLHAAGVRLDNWLKDQNPAAAAREGIGGWLGAQKERLNRFWYDTPEATSARGLRSAGKVHHAFDVLDAAIRARPDSPELLRELYRLYDGLGLVDLCYRPLRQIEKLAAVRGAADAWVLEALARLCERLGRRRPGMVDRAVAYWSRLETVTGVSYARERAAVMALKALADGGFKKPPQPTERE